MHWVLHGTCSAKTTLTVVSFSRSDAEACLRRLVGTMPVAMVSTAHTKAQLATKATEDEHLEECAFKVACERWIPAFVRLSGRAQTPGPEN